MTDLINRVLVGGLGASALYLCVICSWQAAVPLSLAGIALIASAFVKGEPTW